MRTFEFTLVVDGVDLADPTHVDALIAGGCGDDLPVARDGVTMLAFAREADTAEAALCSALEDVEANVPGTLVTRLDADLVSTSDIAERLERSRESVRLLVEGKRGPGGFPCPVGWVGDGIRVWRWADVHDWARRSLGFDMAPSRSTPPLRPCSTACSPSAGGVSRLTSRCTCCNACGGKTRVFVGVRLEPLDPPLLKADLQGDNRFAGAAILRQPRAGNPFPLAAAEWAAIEERIYARP